MSLSYGTEPKNPEGMTLTIYNEMDKQLSPPLSTAIADAKSDEEKKAAEDALTSARDSWKKLAYAIATGVVDYLKANLEIVMVKTVGNVNASVNDQTGSGGIDGHVHNVSLSAVQFNVIFTQNNDGTGLVR
jgi:hypothetical protein